jgi:excisionase family DNA binding protein
VDREMNQQTTLIQLDAEALEEALETVVKRVVRADAEDTWFTVEEAAEHLSLTEDALRQLLRRGRIPSHRIGERRIRFSKAELDNWIRSGAAEAA